MSDQIPIFGFIRLHANGSSCRASQWRSDGTRECWSAEEWGDLIQKSDGIHCFRAHIESLRLYVSDILGRDGIDPLGAFRSLFLSERVSSTLEAWIRDGGWVHVLVGSGMHLIVFQELIVWMMIRIGQRFNLDPIRSHQFSLFMKWLVFGIFWALSGFRAGLLRVLFIQGFRDYAHSNGRTVSSPRLLSLACALDLFLAYLFSFGNETDPSEFGAGRIHYALSIYGGYYGYLTAKERGFGHMKMHASLAIYSWLPTALLDLMVDRKISFMIPLYSWISIPILTSVIFPLSVVSIGLGLVGIEFGFRALEWASVLWNLLLEKSSTMTFEWGLYRELSTHQSWSAFLLGVIFLIIFRGFQKNQRRSRPPSTTKTSPVTHDASSLRKKRIADATSFGSPTRPKGKAEPRRA